jgi:glycosyltransferase involved in cell wall biosynthesis
LEDLDVDIVHDHSLAGPLVALGRATPTVVTSHGPLHSWVGDYYGALRLPLVAISDAQREEAPGLPWVATVHNAIDVQAYRFRSAKDGYALFLGRISPEKGAHVAPAIARAAGVPLVMAAKCNEPDERRYFDEAVAPAFGPETTWVGEVGGDQRKDLLAGASCLVVPVQREEPFGLVMVEALASGTPVVGLARGAVPEIVRHGETGWVCDDVEKLGHYVARAGEIDPEACRHDALRRFDLPVFVERHEDVYRRVLRGPDS